MSDEHRKCIAIGCPLHQQCQLPINYDAKIRIWPAVLGRQCEHFVYRREDE